MAVEGIGYECLPEDPLFDDFDFGFESFMNEGGEGEEEDNSVFKLEEEDWTFVMGGGNVGFQGKEELFHGKEELVLNGETETKYSDSSLSDNCSGEREKVEEELSAEVGRRPERKRKLEEEVSPTSATSEYAEELERRLAILARENKDLRQQLASLKQANRSLRTHLQSIAIPQQSYLLSFAHNMQDALTVNNSPRTKASTGVTLCVFFLLGAFFLPGLFNSDMDNRDLAMLPSDPFTNYKHINKNNHNNFALPDGTATTHHQLPDSMKHLQHYGQKILALPMTEEEQRRRDAVFMCPKVVSVFRNDQSNNLDYISVVLPTASISSSAQNPPPKPSFTELVCEVRRVNELAALSLHSTTPNTNSIETIDHDSTHDSTSSSIVEKVISDLPNQHASISVNS